MITIYNKKLIAVHALKSQDLDSKAFAASFRAVAANAPCPNQRDYLTSYIVESINSANDIDDVLTDLEYAINQLRRASNAIESID